MDAVKTHYDKLLGSVYSWIIGDFDTAFENNVRLFDQLNILPVQSGIAVDLGAGPGSQSLPLAARGFDVTAIDFCADLLDELRSHPGGDKVTTVLADIRDFCEYLDAPADLIVCMGDTLVHLPDRADARQLLLDAARSVSTGGSVVVSIRDYDAPGPTGADRFIPIRSSDEQIFTCFLEYEDDIVRVHDLLQRRENGVWNLSVSGYQKLRISMDWVEETLAGAGLEIVRRLDDGGMLVLHARK